MKVLTFNEFKTNDSVLESTTINESVAEKVNKATDKLKNFATFGATDKDLPEFKDEDMKDGFEDIVSSIDELSKKVGAFLKKVGSKIKSKE